MDDPSLVRRKTTGNLWVFDTSPLIALGKIGLLGKLPALCSDCVIPNAVADELLAGRDTDPAKQWLLSEPAVRVLPSSVPAEVLRWGLGSGEPAAISFAYLNREFDVVLDERLARKCAESLGLQPRGTLGILIYAKRCGIIREARPFISALLTSGYYLAPDLLAAVLEEAGEQRGV